MLTQEMDMDISVIRPRKLAHSQMDMDMDISNSLTRAISTHKRGGYMELVPGREVSYSRAVVGSASHLGIRHKSPHDRSACGGSHSGRRSAAIKYAMMQKVLDMVQNLYMHATFSLLKHRISDMH